MSTNPPVTIWEGADGAELTPSDGALIDTEASLILLTEAGLELQIEDSDSTAKPVTVWATDNSQ